MQNVKEERENVDNKVRYNVNTCLALLLDNLYIYRLLLNIYNIYLLVIIILFVYINIKIQIIIN